MMPIVDALMHLPASPECQKPVKALLDDYLAQHVEIHVLRALVVQPALGVAESSDHAELMQLLATTRGSGGLPHGLLVHMALDESCSNEQLLARLKHACVRGIVVEVGNNALSIDAVEASVVVQHQQQLEKMQSVVNLNLLDYSSAACHAAIELVKACQSIPFVLQFDLVNQIDSIVDMKMTSQLDRFLAELGQFDNTYITVCGSHDLRGDSFADLVASTVDQMTRLFGYERVMFGSNYPNQTQSESCDALWRTYSACTAGLSASNRDKLFRSNAFGLYRL